MNQYPLVEAFDLQFHIFDYTRTYYLKVEDLEKALQDAPAMAQSFGDWVQGTEIIGGKSGRENIATYTARLVCIQPIKKKTKAEAALGLLEELNQNRGLNLINWEDKIIRILEMPE